MNKFNIKSYIVLVSVTTIAILFSTLLLKEGVTLVSGFGVGKIEKVAASEKEVLHPILGEKEKSKGNIKVSTVTNPKRTSPKVSKQSTKPKGNNAVKTNGDSGNDTKGESGDSNNQDDTYNSVKDKINIQKEDAKKIFSANILKLFGSSVNVSDSNLTFLKKNGIEETEYEWSLSITDSENKKFYSGTLNAMTGECTSMSKIDYNGFDKPEDAGYTNEGVTPLSDEDTQKYISKAEEFIYNNGILNSNTNKIQKVIVKKRMNMGLRPMAGIDVTMEDGSKAEISFYTDTEQLMSLDIN